MRAISNIREFSHQSGDPSIKELIFPTPIYPKGKIGIKLLGSYILPNFYTKTQMEKVLFDLLADWKKKQNEEG